ncbi:Hypp60 [Branchiostoma lanceolatum]|uniref:Hypp60 protein n=1 Tax=Branchiostoma lanceolatum TaxID=7740 RepID=A0A8J9VXB2_BRALA|nr:Hypp60 [Branchiostoma lanceolatum]
MACETRRPVGLTVSVVKNGDVVFSKGYGKRDLNQGLPVDNRTLFGVGSISKSFTATLLASILAERDDVTWDTPIVDVLGPDFRFQDEFLTKRTTLRDVLAHRTGLQRFSTRLLQFGMDIDRVELARRVRHFSEVRPFRTAYYYNNFLFALAGHVAERLAGKTFEQLLRERILLPLGMNDTTFVADALEEGNFSNFAQNYVTYSENGHSLAANRESYRIMKLHAPSGGVASNAVDMARYVQLHLGGGKGPDGRTLVPEELIREAHTLQFFKPYQPDREIFRPQYPVGVMNNGEGFGVALGDYRGKDTYYVRYRRMYRSGGFMGFSSLMSLYPDVSGGVFTSFNGPAVPEFVKDVNSIIHYRVADMLLGLDPWLNTTTACSFPQPWATHPVTDVTMPPAPSRDFPRDKRDYEGTFGNSIFGNLTVYLNSTDDTLRFKGPVDLEQH